MKKPHVRDIVRIALSTALLAVCAWIAIPVSIPFTLQTLAVFLAAGLLGARRATAAVCVYLLLGLMGAPVFSGFRGGPGVLLGATGGYLLGFIPAAALSGAMMDRLGRSFPCMLGSMLLGMAVYYFVGTVWFVLVYLQTTLAAGFVGALGLCVLPYLLPDVLKVLVSAYLTKKLYARVNAPLR